MSFTLPELPYAYDALAPYMSRETLEYHHDKHHLAYVNNGNNLLKGSEWEGKSLEDIMPVRVSRAGGVPLAKNSRGVGSKDSSVAGNRCDAAIVRSTRIISWWPR